MDVDELLDVLGWDLVKYVVGDYLALQILASNFFTRRKGHAMPDTDLWVDIVKWLAPDITANNSSEYFDRSDVILALIMAQQLSRNDVSNYKDYCTQHRNDPTINRECDFNFSILVRLDADLVDKSLVSMSTLETLLNANLFQTIHYYFVAVDNPILTPVQVWMRLRHSIIESTDPRIYGVVKDLVRYIQRFDPSKSEKFLNYMRTQFAERLDLVMAMNA